MKVLVYPFGTEIAFEIYRSLSKVKNIELWGGTSDYNNHGLYVYDNVIGDWQFISDTSPRDDVEHFAKQIESYNFDFIYPAMDGCLAKFAEFRDVFSGKVIAPDFGVAETTRSKSKTYSLLKDCIKVPVCYDDINKISEYPVFVKPDVGQGSVGAKKISDQIKNVGGWFFQLKKNKAGEYVLLEVASRIAGTSGFTRCIGANLPLLTLYTFQGQYIKEIPLIGYKELHIDRALYNAYKSDIEYDSVYVDYDDTLVVDGHLNIQLITFLYSCIDKGLPVYLFSRHDDEKFGKLDNLLEKYHLQTLFDEIIHIGLSGRKSTYIKSNKAIFIDDSYGERMAVKKTTRILVFDPSMVEH